MSALNQKKSYSAQTHEGGTAALHLTPLQQLKRSVMACFLWENQFYEDGQSIANRIEELAKQVTAQELFDVINEARNTHNLRSVSMLLAACMVKYHQGHIVQDAVDCAIQRADELTEIMAVYQKDGKTKIDRQLIKGVRKAFKRFTPYQLARNQAIGKAWSLRDVLQIVHPKPVNDEQSQCFKQILEKTLSFPESWQTELSAGGDKKEVFTRLINEKKLGTLDVLRNLRNMTESGVDIKLIRNTVSLLNTKGVLPFRFVAAARACPSLEREIDLRMMDTIKELPKLNGVTVVLVDVSGSMDAKLSAKSDLTRMDAAAALASIINADDLRIYSFSSNLVECPARKGMAGIDAIINSQHHSSTNLDSALQTINNSVKHDRIIVITDEQSNSRCPNPAAEKAYMINVASYKNGVGYGKWTHIDGFSENVLKWIYELEK